MQVFPLGSSWIIWSLALYVLAAVCWLPVVCLQLKMRNMAALAASNNLALPDRYWLFEKIWTALGFPAFGGLLVVYWLMVHKPV